MKIKYILLAVVLFLLVFLNSCTTIEGNIELNIPKGCGMLVNHTMTSQHYVFTDDCDIKINMED